MLLPNSFSLEKTVVSANILCFGAAQTILFALLPLLQEKTTLPISSLVICLSLGTLFFIPGTLFWTHRSDEGKTFQSLLINVLFLSLSLVTVCFLFAFHFSATTALLIFLSGRIMWGLGASGIPGLSQKLQLERAQKKIEGVTQNSLFLNVGRSLGPTLFLTGLHPQYALFFFFSLTVVVFLLNFFLKAPETKITNATKDKYSLPSFKLLAPVVLTFVMTIATGLIHTGLGDHIQNLFSLSGLEATSKTAQALTVGSIFLILGFLFARKINDEKWKNLILIGAVVMTGSLMTLAYAKAFGQILAAIGGISFSVSFLHTGAIMLLDYLSGSQTKAKSLGVLQIAATTGGAFGGMILSFTTGHFSTVVLISSLVLFTVSLKALTSLQLREASWKA